MLNIPAAIAENILGFYIKNRNRNLTPEINNAGSFKAKTCDAQWPVSGWYCKRQGDIATIFLAHGFTGNSMSEEIVDIGKHIYEKYPVSIVSLDLRFHGLSHNRSVTFGTAEMWDIQAALDWAIENGFSSPYILYGESLGAMASARTAISDSRIKGAFLKSCPGWPWDAIGVKLLAGVMLGEFIKGAYGWDILGDGDLRKHNPSPSHNPLICYVMGQNDEYGIDKTKKIYEHWYNGCFGGYDVYPGTNKEHRKWFITIPGHGHDLGQKNYSKYYEILDSFLRCCIDSVIG